MRSVPCPPTSRRPHVAFARGSVTSRALRREELPSRRDRPRPLRQAGAIGRNGRSQLADLFRRRRPSHSVSRRLRRQGGEPPRRSIALSFHIRHRPVGADVPDLDAVVVVDGIGPAGGNQRCARRLDVAGFIDGARGDERRPGRRTATAVGSASARSAAAAPAAARLTQRPSTVGRDLDALDPPASGPRQAGQFVQTRAPAASARRTET